MIATRPAAHPPQARPDKGRGPYVSGIDLSAGAVRIVVARREDARLRVTGKGESPLAGGAMNGGLVSDRVAVADGLREAFAAAEHTQRAERVAVALDSDDMRTFHWLTSFEREDSRSPVSAGEVARAIREAGEDARAHASAALEEDAALRGVPAAQLEHHVAALALDGRALPSLEGHRGRLVEVWTDVTLAPLVVTGATTASLEVARRRGSAVSGAYALGRLLTASGITDAGIVRLGADTTAVAILREGRVVATRVFALGREALAARAGRAESDAKVWADCVVASLRGLDGPPPGRWIFVGVPEALLALPTALGDAVSGIRGDRVDIAPLAVAMVTRVYGDVALRPDDLVAVGAAALAAGLYE